MKHSPFEAARALDGWVLWFLGPLLVHVALATVLAALLTSWLPWKEAIFGYGCAVLSFYLGVYSGLKQAFGWESAWISLALIPVCMAVVPMDGHARVVTGWQLTALLLIMVTAARYLHGRVLLQLQQSC